MSDTRTAPEVAPGTPPGLLDAVAAQEYLGGISRGHLRNLTRAGALRDVRVGRRVMYRRHDLDRFIDGLDGTD